MMLTNRGPKASTMKKNDNKRKKNVKLSIKTESESKVEEIDTISKLHEDGRNQIEETNEKTKKLWDYVEENAEITFEKRKTKNRWTKEERDELSSLVTDPFNETQLEALRVMRECLSEEIKAAKQYPEVVSDQRLFRFLRGHLFDIEIAAWHYRKMLNWRKLCGIDRIRTRIVNEKLAPTEFPHYQQVKRYQLSDMHFGFDKNDRPMHIEVIGDFEPKKAMSCFDEESFLEHHIYSMEYNAIQMHKCTLNKQRLVRTVAIYDLKGLSKSHLYKPMLNLLKKTLKMTQEFYPETTEKIYIVNCPTIFTMVWSLVKPWLAERTVNKIEIFGKSYQSKLLDSLGKHSLGEDYGGSSPRSMKAVKKENVFKTYEYQTLSVVRRTQETVHLDVDKNSLVNFGYYSDSQDTNVVVEFLDKNSSPTLLYAVEKKDASCGSFVAPQKGKFRVKFENNSSWTMKNTISINYYIEKEEKTNV